VTGTVALFGFAFWVGDPTKQALTRKLALNIFLYFILIVKREKLALN
jgi:hypothetical protein